MALKLKHFWFRLLLFGSTINFIPPYRHLLQVLMAKMINLKPLLCNIKFSRKLLCLLNFSGLHENPHEQKYPFFSLPQDKKFLVLNPLIVWGFCSFQMSTQTSGQKNTKAKYFWFWEQFYEEINPFKSYLLVMGIIKDANRDRVQTDLLKQNGIK